MEDGETRSPSTDDFEIISYDPLDGKLMIETEDFGLHGRSWTLRVTRRSLLSTMAQNQATNFLTIRFKDVCWESALVAPQFIYTGVSFELYQSQSIYFNNMENLSEGSTFCGGFTYSLDYVSGPLTTGNDALKVYEFVPSSVSMHKV